MADEDGSKTNPVIDKLEESPWNSDFFQVVRRLECMFPDLPRVGCSRFRQEDVVRFRQNVSLAFAPSAIAGYERPDHGRPASLSINCFGLLGPNGPMPLYLTEYVRNRLRNSGDGTLAAFLDVFNHRMVSLFYRAWASCQQTVSFDRAGDDRFLFYLGSLFGIGSEAFRDRDALADIAKIHYSGRFACPTKNAEGLQAILEDYFKVTFEITQFVGQWLEFPEEYHCRLGGSAETGTMGETLVMGSRFLECQQKFRLRAGPMSFDFYQRLLPRGESLRRLVAIVRNYASDVYAWELQLVLKAEEIPQTCLGKLGRVGLSTWLSTKEAHRDADQLVLTKIGV